MGKIQFGRHLLHWLVPGVFSFPAFAAIDTNSSRAEETLTVSSTATAGTPPVTPAAGSASRLAIPLKEIPRSLEVITQNDISRRGDRSLADAINHSTGVSGVASPTLSNSFSLRGFMPVSWLYNGLEMPGSTLQLGSPFHYSQIDILHGPGSVLNGLSATGGSVNLIPKEPTFWQAPLTLNYRTGSHNEQLAEAGTGGPLWDDKIAYRLDVSGGDSKTNVKHERNRQYRISGSLLFRLTDDTTLTLYGDRMENRSNNPYFGTPLIDGKISRKLRNINYNNLTDSKITSHANAFQADITSLLTENITFNTHAWYYNGYRHWHNVERYRYSPAEPGMVNRDSWGDLDHRDQLLANRTSFTLNHALLGLDNAIILGAEVSRRQFRYQKNGFPGSQDVSLYSPVREPFRAQTTLTRFPYSNVTQRQVGAFFEDHLQLTDTVALLGQARYTRLDMAWRYYSPAQRYRRNDTFGSSGLGITWDALQYLTLYTSYTDGKEAGDDIFFLSPEQTHLPLTRARQWELGAKSTFPDNLGDLTLALYQLRKKNLFTASDTIPGQVDDVGQQTSRGIELGVTLRPWTQWEFAGNLAWTHARLDKFSAGPGQNYDGNRPAYIPAWTGNLSAAWRPLPPLGLRADLHYVGNSYNDNANQNPMGHYATVDLSTDYQLTKDIVVGTRVRNLTDRLYAYQRTYPGQVLIAPGRTWEGWVSVTF